MIDANKLISELQRVLDFYPEWCRFHVEFVLKGDELAALINAFQEVNRKFNESEKALSMFYDMSTKLRSLKDHD